MAGLRPGESFLTASTRQRKADDAAEKRAEAKREKSLTDAEDRARRRSWVTSHSVFVPKQLAAPPPKKPKPKPVPIMQRKDWKGGGERSDPQQESDRRRAEVRKLNTESRRKERFQLGLKTKAPQATIYDAVPVGRTKHDQGIALALQHPPTTLTPKELRDWRKKMVGFSTFSPGEKTQFTRDADREFAAAQKAAEGNVLGINDITYAGKRIAETAKDAVGKSIDWQTKLIAGDPETQEGTLEAGLGKGITNALIHGDMPNTLGQAGGLAAGILTVGPVGRAGRAGFVGGKLAFDAIRAEQGIRAALEAGKVGGSAAFHGPSVTKQVIQWGKDARAARPYSAAKQASVRANAGSLVAMREGFIEAGEHDAAAQIEQILDKAGLGPNGEFHGWDAAATGKRVASKLNEKNVAKGVVRGNTQTIRNAQGIHVAGPFSNDDWVQKVIAAFPTKGDRNEWARWYEEFAPAFRDAFGDQAEELMRGFAVSQANNSPTGGLLATLRVLDRLMAGDTAKQISNKGIGTKSLVKTIAKAVEGEGGKVDEGVAAKLSDFIDSFLNKDTRTWMGDHEHGGMPSAIDVHAMRDQGLIDKKLVAKLEQVHGLKHVDPKIAAKRGLRAGEFTTDSSGSASGPLYERLSERYQEIAQHLNQMDEGRGFDGRNDWKPKEVQALGWGATQKIHGVDPENLGSAFLGNTRTFDIQAGKNLTEAEAADVVQAMTPHVEKIVRESVGQGAFVVRPVEAGVFGGAHGANPSLHFQVMGSPEQAQALTNRLARIFPDHNVTAFKVGGQKSRQALRVRGIPDEESARAVWQSLKGQHKRFGGSGYTFVNGELIVNMPGGAITAAEKETWNQEVAPFVEQALRDAGISDDVPLEFNGANLQTLKGNADAADASRGGRSGGRRGALERRTDAQAKRALDGALGRLAKSRARRAAESVANPTMGIVPGGGGLGGPKFARSIAESTARVNEEVAGRVPRFASEATPRTALQVSQRIVELDAELDPLVAEAARSLKKAGFGTGTRESLARTDKPSYFQSYGQYEQAKQDAYEARAAKWRKKHPGQKYGGSHYTEQWKDWGEDERFTWGDPETYALENAADVKTDRSMGWYRDQGEKQIMEQLTKMAQEKGPNRLKARRMLMKFQERESLKSLEAKNQGGDLFPEDVPAGGYGADLKATPLRPPPRSEAQRLEDALRPKEPTPLDLPPRPTRTRVDARRGGAPPPPPKGPVAQQLPGEPFDEDFLKEVMARMKKELPSAKPLRAEQEGLRSEERGNRLKIALHEFEMGGPEAMIRARQALHGELPRLDWGGFDFLDQPAIDALHKEIIDRNDFQGWEKVRLIWALDKVVHRGRIPTKSEHALLDRLIGKDAALNLGDPENLSMMRKLYNLGMEIWNTPRSIMASFDLSAPFRQGLVAGARHPIIFGKNFKPMIQAMRSEDGYAAIMNSIADDPNFARAEIAGLGITDVHGVGGAREEQFPGSLAERMPILGDMKVKGHGTGNIVGRSSRAYSAFLNKMRMDVFNHMLEVAGGPETGMLGRFGKGSEDIDDPKFLKALGEYINNATGRGKIPGKHGEDAAQFLNTFLFSPRLLASRFNTISNPVYYARLFRDSPFVARQQAQAAVTTLGGMAAFLTLASQIPGWKVGMNPTSSDFGKIRIGDTRIDVAGGFQPLLVAYMRIIKNRTTVSSTGENRPFGGYGGKDRFMVLERFMEGKMAPVPGLFRDYAHNKKTFVGDPMTLKGELWNMLSPLNIQGTYETWKNDGYDMAAVTALLSSIGFGTNSYPDSAISSGSGGGGLTGGVMPMPDDTGGGGLPMPDAGGGGGLLPMPP